MKYQQNEHNTVKRGAKRASYDKELIHSILDAVVIGYMAFTHEGKAHVQPINYGRKDETLFIHGSLQNRMTSSILETGFVSMNVTILDGLILTKSAFHHSVNYRSAVIFGTVRELHTNDEKMEGLKALINHFIPGRWEHCRKPTDNELKATRVLAIDITAASAKIKNTPPNDNEEDLALPFWAGTIPVKTVYKEPISHENVNTTVPDHVIILAEKNKNGI